MKGGISQSDQAALRARLSDIRYGGTPFATLRKDIAALLDILDARDADLAGAIKAERERCAELTIMFPIPDTLSHCAREVNKRDGAIFDAILRKPGC